MFRITTVVENTSASKPKFRAEHGLSIFIETKKEKFFFDTGQSDVFVHNAKLLNIDLTKINKVVLSHGHYDHGGGLKYLLDYTKPVVYGHPEIFRDRYSKLSDTGKLRYLGIEKREFYEEKGIRFVLDDKPMEVSENIYTTGFEEMTTDFEEVDKNFVYKKNGVYEKDDVTDDMSLILDVKKGLFIIFGCAHRGIINIIRQAEKTFNKRVFGFIGGTHLGPASDYQRKMVIEELEKMDLEIIGPSHCTGLKMTAELYCAFKDRVIFNNVGTVLEV